MPHHKKKAEVIKHEERTVTECMDDLQLNCERTLALLKDRQPGLMTWNKMLYDRIHELKNCLTNLGVK